MNNGKKNIAIITGAAGGIGSEFAAELMKEPLDEIWAVGRNLGKLTVLKERYGEKLVPLQKDLTRTDEILSFSELLKSNNCTVKWLVNNAGVSKLMMSADFEPTELEQTIDINCKAPTILINVCLPFMESGCKILNISSASAFQPVPLINLYASTKAFLRSYSRALNVELKPRGITVTAVCPSWVDTDMLPKEVNGIKVKYDGIVNADDVVKKAVKDAKKGKDMSVCGFYVKCQHLNVKLMPQRWSMKLWISKNKKFFG